MSDSTDTGLSSDLDATVLRMKKSGEAFAVATVVRTVSVTAAKPGAKALLNEHGEIIDGWIGGGCARHAVVKAAREALADGEPRLISLLPEELLKEQGLSTGVDEGVLIASNMCPSKGSMDIFVEPVLSNPELLVVGESPVAVMLVRLAPLFDLTVSTMGNTKRIEQGGRSDNCYNEFADIPISHPHRYIVIATQGSGDIAALSHALSLESQHLAFVGSGRKLAHLNTVLAEQGAAQTTLDKIKGPAGLDIKGVTPQEIALSILAELIQIRRSK